MLVLLSGIYILQNTMVGGGDGRWGKKIENKDLGEKNEKGERKREENYMKTRGKRP